MPTNAHQHASGHLAGVRTPRDGAPVWPPASPSSTAHRPVRRSGQLPRRANWRPMPPSLGREAPPAAPSPRDWGTGDRLWATTVRSPAAPTLTQHNAATVTDPQSLSPGPLGPGRFYTNPPTPFGV
ncbi:hypothetical protein N7449_000027 [Penicillium cf. viridicatum]|uniref:Uncharacterized protein n=1 Tax=Penicillium cf. viridicatum TaxID=2972119 RepID=A0A9W9N484_9EURO|nr:hypothetical protein N7449_012555 [Penicillium cf. viridicatum]KAJ5181010.1 hypothetical protein N7449_012561 [Penicillium cf. viridicatum]KAJ5181037.1 hypothetical protein N7449_012588 [Penicillium cf. viridicatum]KAJ5181043.1 hypothetical protein N7449_012594 [Penicillium cf. viridicatum]KAJ5181049.1 hypothetical protein N7449_012600 [Penicillium cf. viridicatum]